MCRNLEKEDLLNLLGSSNPQPNAQPPPQNPYPAAPLNFGHFEATESQIFSLPHSGYIPDPNKP